MAKFLAHGQAHMGQMGGWPWQCTTKGLDNSTEHWIEKIRQEVTEIWVPQVWQPPARPEGWGVKDYCEVDEWALICRDLYQHRWMGEVKMPTMTVDNSQFQWSGSQEASLVMPCHNLGYMSVKGSPWLLEHYSEFQITEEWDIME